MTSTAFFNSIATPVAAPGHKETFILSDGRVALLWSEGIPPGFDDDRLMLQLDAASPTAPAPVVLSSGDLLYSDPTLLELPDGRLVVSWRAYDRVAGVENDRVVVQVLDAQGAAQGQPVTFPTPDIYWFDKTLSVEGSGFALTWWDQTYNETTESFEDTVIRRQGFDASGAVQGPAVEIGRIAEDQVWPVEEMVLLANGDVAAVWKVTNHDATVGRYSGVQADTVFAQIFAPDGTARSGVIAVSAPDSTSSARSNLIALAGGGFAILWSDGFAFEGNRSILARRFDADGNPQGATIEDIAFGVYRIIDAATLPDGRVVLATDTRTSEFTGSGVDTQFNVSLQELGPDLVPLGPREQVLTDVRNPFEIDLVTDSNDRVVIVWGEEGTNTSRLSQFDATAFTRLTDGDDMAVMDGSEAGLNAGAGNDSVTGSISDDIILGGAGDDTLNGNAGNDALAGDAGSDRLLGDAGDDTLIGGEGGDILNGGAGADLIEGGGVGTGFQPGPDLSDTIFGLEGADTIDAGAGNDLVWGGTQDDFIFGGAGADMLAGQDGADTLEGGEGADLLFGGAGNDLIDGGQGFDRANGGAGADMFYHVSRIAGRTDWIQDFNTAEGDVLTTDRADVIADWYRVNFGLTPGAGQADTAEAFVIFRPTGQIVWALVDGAGNDAINIQIGGVEYDLLG